MKKIAVIMAGGSGERFWPLSRIKKPKQMLKLSSSGMTMLEESIARVQNVFDNDDIFIVTSEVLQDVIREHLRQLPPQNIIAEPFKRNTAPCLALSAAFIKSKYHNISENEIVVAVLTADHLINPVEKFNDSINHALNFAYTNDCIVTMGIRPTRPETGYGYIELDNSLDYQNSIFRAVKFHEKPDIKNAQMYLAKGNFLWNSGMFFYRLDYFIQQMKKHLKVVGESIDTISGKYLNNTGTAYIGSFADIKEDFEALPDISIDYGLMEKADDVYVIKSDFRWDDLGSWDSLERVRQGDDNGNITDGDVELLESHDNIIYNNTNRKLVITGFGIENMVIVATDDAIMVCPKDKVQNVKKIINNLKEKGKKELL